MSKSALDFVIIGAQKAGTTSLYRYLQPHPQIYMPPEKEAQFFNHDERFAKGWEWYLAEFFAGAPEAKLWGKATPNYLSDPRVPERIREVLPEVRLVALLRDPIERAYSHYAMACRRGAERRSFDQAVGDQLEKQALEEARARPDLTNSYVARGEYGRLLGRYYGLFPQSQVRVFFTEDLSSDPARLVQQTLEFLGADTAFVPSNLGLVYHKGGTKAKVPWLPALRRIRPVRAIWTKLVPWRYRRRLGYWLFQWNAIPDNGQPHLLESTRTLLVGHFEDDVKQLSGLLGRDVPWSHWLRQ
jgi:hypothetical protein